MLKTAWTGLTRTLRFIVSVPIYAYRVLISPLLPKTCRYEPTCSAYCLEAIARHGALKGLVLGVKRVWRCAPWCKHVCYFDPVPDVFILWPGRGKN